MLIGYPFHKEAAVFSDELLLAAVIFGDKTFRFFTYLRGYHGAFVSDGYADCDAVFHCHIGEQKSAALSASHSLGGNVLFFAQLCYTHIGEQVVSGSYHHKSALDVAVLKGTGNAGHFVHGRYLAHYGRGDDCYLRPELHKCVYPAQCGSSAACHNAFFAAYLNEKRKISHIITFPRYNNDIPAEDLPFCRSSFFRRIHR